MEKNHIENPFIEKRFEVISGDLNYFFPTSQFILFSPKTGLIFLKLWGV